MSMQIDGEDVLRCPMKFKNDADSTTIREYLVALLATLWAEGEGFSGKRPFGNSCWEYELYRALVEAGYVQGNIVDGDFYDVDKVAADSLIFDAIDTLRVI